MKKSMTGTDLRAAADVLDKIENETYRKTGLHRINGGFATAAMSGFSKTTFDVVLQWGVQDGEEDRVETEHLKISRKTLKRVDA